MGPECRRSGVDARRGRRSRLRRWAVRGDRGSVAREPGRTRPRERPGAALGRGHGQPGVQPRRLDPHGLCGRQLRHGERHAPQLHRGTRLGVGGRAAVGPQPQRHRARHRADLHPGLPGRILHQRGRAAAQPSRLGGPGDGGAARLGPECERTDLRGHPRPRHDLPRRRRQHGGWPDAQSSRLGGPRDRRPQRMEPELERHRALDHGGRQPGLHRRCVHEHGRGAVGEPRGHHPRPRRGLLSALAHAAPAPGRRRGHALRHPARRLRRHGALLLGVDRRIAPGRDVAGRRDRATVGNAARHRSVRIRRDRDGRAGMHRDDELHAHGDERARREPGRGGRDGAVPELRSDLRRRAIRARAGRLRRPASRERHAPDRPLEARALPAGGRRQLPTRGLGGVVPEPAPAGHRPRWRPLHGGRRPARLAVRGDHRWDVVHRRPPGHRPHRGRLAHRGIGGGPRLLELAGGCRARRPGQRGHLRRPDGHRAGQPAGRHDGHALQPAALGQWWARAVHVRGLGGQPAARSGPGRRRHAERHPERAGVVRVHRHGERADRVHREPRAACRPWCSRSRAAACRTA